MNLENDALHRSYVIKQLSMYWPKNADKIYDLPIPYIPHATTEPLLPALIHIELPGWAQEIGVEGRLFVPEHYVKPSNNAWENTDWIGACFWYLNGLAERAFEKLYGPIQSYSFRLKGWDERMWDHAWVNRIALFLRRWAAKVEHVDEESLFGSLPQPEIILTHDVDAVKKTIAIRLKQTSFHLYNGFKNLMALNLSLTFHKFRQALSFLFSYSDYWCFAQIIELESEYNVKSLFNFYGGPGGWTRSIKQLLFDPAYNVKESKLSEKIKELSKSGWETGLHSSYDTWNNSDEIKEEKNRLESVLEKPVLCCRQHWLRFSWQETWKAQEEAGLALDMTLGFNDRPGYRNGCALRFPVWDDQQCKPMKLEALPVVLMDSHLYDYHQYTDEERNKEIARWVDETKTVGGQASVIWHQQVMSQDYGWYGSYKTLLDLLG